MVKEFWKLASIWWRASLHILWLTVAGFWVTLYDPTSFSVACCLIYLFTQLCKISCCSLLLMWRSCNRCAVNRIDSVMYDLNFSYYRTFFVPYRLIVQTCAKVIIRRRCHLQRTCYNCIIWAMQNSNASTSACAYFLYFRYTASADVPFMLMSYRVSWVGVNGTKMQGECVTLTACTYGVCDKLVAADCQMQQLASERALRLHAAVS